MMIAPAGKEPLIKKISVDKEKCTVVLTIPSPDAMIGASVVAEIEDMRQKKYGDALACTMQGSDLLITINGQDIAQTALITTQVMTRRVQELTDPSQGEPTLYASFNDTKSVLNTLKQHAEEAGKPHAVTAVDKLLGVVSQIQRM